MQQMLWLYLQFPRLQLDLLNAASPAAAQALPQILLDPKSHRVRQHNTSATSRGIKTGMPLAQACALAADLQVRAWQAELEQQQLQQVANALYQHCADLALSPPTALWLRLDPMLTLYKNLPTLLASIFAVLQLFELDYQAGIAPSAQAARLCALHKPSLQITELAALSEGLSPIAIQLLPLPAEVQEQFIRLGIQTLGQWLALSPQALSRRFSLELQWLREEILALRPTRLSWWQPVAGFRQRLELYWHTELIEQLHKPLLLLLRQLQQFLERSDQRSYQTTLQLELQGADSETITLRSPKALVQASQWLELWQQKLSRLHLTSAVSAITLSTDNLVAQGQTTADLYNNSPAQTDPLMLLALLQARLGERQVRQPQVPNGWLPSTSSALTTTTEQPDISCSPIASVAMSAAAQHSLPSIWTHSSSAPRPAFIYPEPIVLQQRIHWQPGVERLHSQWWQAPAMRQDLRIGLSEDGRWLWLCRQQQANWHVLGIFA